MHVENYVDVDVSVDVDLAHDDEYYDRGGNGMLLSMRVSMLVLPMMVTTMMMVMMTTMMMMQC